jgi:hypothetical protein
MILFFDDCHKIYYAADDDHFTINKMRSYGYEPFAGDADDMQGLWENSCSLRFISPANLDTNAPHVYQCDEREDVTDFANDVIAFLG